MDFQRAFALHRGDKGHGEVPRTLDPMPYDLIQRTVEKLIEQHSPESGEPMG